MSELGEAAELMSDRIEEIREENKELRDENLWLRTENESLREENKEASKKLALLELKMKHMIPKKEHVGYPAPLPEKTKE